MMKSAFPNSCSKEEIIASHERIKNYIHRTPILSSSTIDQQLGCSLFFKCENFQKVGSFKIRGAMNAALKLPKDQLKKGLTTHSSGNHAQAISKVAQLLKVPAYIVMPENAPQVKVKAVKEYGGKIIFCAPTLNAREEGVKKVIDEKGAYFIPPYNHPDIINGQATAAKEFFEDQNSLDVLLCPIGGGGLMAGSILSAQYFSDSTQAFGSEPKGADDAYQSLKQKRLIPQNNPITIADGLLTSLGQLNYEIIKSGINEIFTVNDHEIIRAMRLIWERMKVIVEPSCAVPLAAVIKNKSRFKNKKVGIILSGGNIDLDHFFDAVESRIKS